MSKDWALREQGSRDWRMLPVALTMWAASLGSHSAFAWWSEREADALPSDGIGWERLLPGGMACLVLICDYGYSDGTCGRFGPARL